MIGLAEHSSTKFLINQSILCLIQIYHQRVNCMRTRQVAHYPSFRLAHSIFKGNLFNLSSTDGLDAAWFHKIWRWLYFFQPLLWLFSFGCDYLIFLGSMAGNSFLLVQLLHDILNFKLKINFLVWIIRFKFSFFLKPLLVLLMNEFVVVVIAGWTLRTEWLLIRVSYWPCVVFKRVAEDIKWKFVLFQLVNNVLRAAFVAFKILEVREHRECFVEVPNLRQRRLERPSGAN
jgi:hypothetical protein